MFRSVGFEFQIPTIIVMLKADGQFEPKLAKKARVNLAEFGLISDSGLTLFVSGIMNWNIQKGNGVMSISERIYEKNVY